MIFKPIGMEDKNIIDSFLKNFKFSTSEYNFTNLFMWRNYCSIQYTILHDTLILKKIGFDNSCYFLQPIGYDINNIEYILSEIEKYKKNNNMKYLFREAEKNFIVDLDKLFPRKYEFYEDRDNFDYIYKSRDIINLKGKKFHSQRNHYNYFSKHYDYYVTPINKTIIDNCIALAEKWYKNNNEDYLLYNELQAIKELLRNYDKFDFDCMAIYVDGDIEGFTIGEKINNDMALIHVEKANQNIKGLYNFINKSFIEIYYSDVPYINREEDLGNPWLRMAKQSYKPVWLEKKYSIL